MNYCEVCGSDNLVYKNKKCGMMLCHRHRLQVSKHNKVLSKTIYDKNEIILYNTYAEILLYDKDFNIINRALIDIEDVEKCKLYKWNLSCYGYVITHNKETKKQMRLHRFILNPNDIEIIDHINGNKLDNTKCNLRICTNADNQKNRTKLSSNNTSGYIGVYWNKQKNKWVSEIKSNGKRFYLGSFEDLDDAIKARILAEEKHHKEFKSKVNLDMEF